MTATNVTNKASTAFLFRSLIGASSRAHARSAAYLASAASGRRALSFHLSKVPGGAIVPLSASHAVLDELIKVYFQVGREPLAGIDLGQLDTDLDAILAHHDATGSPHKTPKAPAKTSITRESFGGLRGEWMTFESGWTPHANAPGRDPWVVDDVNQTVHVALLRHRNHAERPWVVLVHGAEMGRQRLDARILRAEYFFETLGVNVAMPVLPRHGPRGPGTGHIRGEFPNQDFIANIHGLTQGVWDVRRLLAWIRQQGADTIGVYGFSLGGNITAQLSQHETDIAALIAGCPAVNMVALIVRNMPHGIQRRHRDLFAKADEASAVISPLSSPPVTPPEALAILGARHDRLADPLDQAGALWRHWGECDMHVLPRGHVSFMFGPDATHTVEAALRSRGVAHYC